MRNAKIRKNSCFDIQNTLGHVNVTVLWIDNDSLVAAAVAAWHVDMANVQHTTRKHIALTRTQAHLHLHTRQCLYV